MALVKWELNKKMSEQISGQNANIDEINKNFNNLKPMIISDSTVSHADWSNLLKKNWATIPTGVSTFSLVAGTTGGGAIGFKSSENYGQFIVIGNARTPDFVQCINGNFAQTKLREG